MKKIYLLLCCCVSIFLLTTCNRDNTTIALPFIGTAQEVIPEEIREAIGEHINIYEGTNPPRIEGQYIASPMIMAFSSDGYNTTNGFADHYFAFTNQHGNVCDYEEKQGNSYGTAHNVSIIGSGNNFTAYFVSENAYNDGVTFFTESTIISGTVTPSGIQNFQYAFILTDKTDPDNRIMDVNEYRVFYDGDYMAYNHQWLDKKENIHSKPGLNMTTSKNANYEK